MSREVSRREFLAAGATAGAAGAMIPGLTACSAPRDQDSKPAAGEGNRAAAAGSGMPVSISSGNGLRATARAVELMKAGGDTLDAAVAGVNIVEEDPDDQSVGYGGLPNEDGVVELDSCVMHGPSWNAGAVAALQGVKTPSRVAQLVLKRTDHVLLVGRGAQRFARAHGFKLTDLLTDKSRRRWLRWKEGLSDGDDWLTPEEANASLESRPSGTINCLALNPRGDLSGVTTTSGLAFKIPGRVGDSPIIGAGLYVDNDVGAAGATGRGEAVIIASGSRIVVENMRHGMSPTEAIDDVLHRITRQTVDPRLRKKDGRPDFNVTFYAVNKKGEYASGALWRGSTFAVHDGKVNRKLESFFLFEG